MRLSWGLWTSFALGLPLVACGARTGLVLPSSDGGTTGTPPGDDAGCVGTSLSVDPNVPNLYFVLDVSSSMAEMDKWTNVRTVVGALITELGATAAFGAAVFPKHGSADTCATGDEVMPLRLGDSLGAAAASFLQATSFAPQGGTPTAATIEALTPDLVSFRGPTFVVLATDGGPNCDAALSCDLESCTSNIDDVGCPAPGSSCCPPEGPNCCVPAKVGGLGCLDGDRLAEAVAKLDALGVETFVLGIPGSAPYASVLDDAATAGGTARAAEPLYYRVDDADTGSLSAALAQIAAQTMASCVFTLAEEPVDPNEVNVSVRGSVVHASGPDGWSLGGAQLTLRGASCSAIQANGGASSLAVTQGCPTLE